MKTKHMISAILLLALAMPASMQAQKKLKDGKPLREEKEWIIEKGGKKRLTYVTVYDSNGNKVEEKDIATYGQKQRITYEYNSEGKIIKKTYYDEKDKLSKYVVPEYDASGVKVKETTFLPKGTVDKVKEIEYIY